MIVSYCLFFQWCVTDIVKMVESVCRLMSVSVNLAGTDQRVIQVRCFILKITLDIIARDPTENY